MAIETMYTKYILNQTIDQLITSYLSRNQIGVLE
jgi:hypothetical protein